MLHVTFSQVAYDKMQERMKAQLGDDYTLFLLEDREGKPTAVVLPGRNANEGSISKTTEVGQTQAYIRSALSLDT